MRRFILIFTSAIAYFGVLIVLGGNSKEGVIVISVAVLALSIISMIAEFRKENKSTTELTTVESPDANYRIVEYSMETWGTMRFHIEAKVAQEWHPTLHCFESLEDATKYIRKVIQQEKELEGLDGIPKHYYLKSK